MVFAGLVIFFFLGIFLSLPFPLVTFAQGEVKPTAETRAFLPNKQGDYELNMVSAPKEEILPGQVVDYTVIYGCSGGNNVSELTLTVRWFFPEGEIMTLVEDSVSTAYGGVEAEIGERSITWRIADFPAQTTSQKVSFSLQALERFREQGTFPFRVEARLEAPPVSKEVSLSQRVSFVGEPFVEKPFREVPAIVWRFAKELFSYPAFNFVVRHLVFLLLLLLLFLAPFSFLVRLGLFPWMFFDLLRWLAVRFLVFFGIKEEPPFWGKVLENSTGQPLQFVRVCVSDLTGEQLAVDFTRKDGFFGFDLPPSRYIVSFSGVNEPICSSENVSVLSENELLWRWDGKEEELVAVFGFSEASYLRWYRVFARLSLEIFDFVLVLGCLLSGLNYYLHPVPVNLFLLGVYLLLLFSWFYTIFLRP